MHEEGFSNAAGMKRGYNGWDVTVRASGVVSEEVYCVCYTEVVVEEVWEGVHLVVAEAFLLGPIRVVLGKPEEVMVVQMHASTEEM
jgi:hypothetical protein